MKNKRKIGDERSNLTFDQDAVNETFFHMIMSNLFFRLSKITLRRKTVLEKKLNLF